MSLQVTTYGETNIFVSANGDFAATVMTSGDAIRIELTANGGEWAFSSGVNVENLTAFLIEVKAACLQKGYNWSGN